MKNEIKQDYRTAVDIMHALQDVRTPSQLSALDDSVEQCNRWRRRLAIASERNWQAAAIDSADRLRGSLDILRIRSEHAIEELKRTANTRIKPTTPSIFREIEGLRGAFEGVSIDRANQKLTVRTSSISLESVALGSFEIRLNWKNIKDSSPFDVIAVDPNCCAANDSVTHPHVQGDSLCEGEGADAIRRALDEGRLFDFFCIVDHVLRNYNAGSAYVQIENWNDINCESCGDSVESGEIFGCCNCETELCLDCSSCCESCCDRYCSECSSSCESCGNETCQTCLKSCDDCGESFCTSCLFEGTCDDCITKQNEANEDDDESTNEPPKPAVHSVRNGKVALHA